MLKVYRTNLLEKLDEALKAVAPILVIVLLLCFTIAPLPTGLLTEFLIGAVLLLAGMMFFTLGAELAMTPIGERMGAGLTRSRKLWLVIGGSFLLGAIITISEPDLQVLAEQVPSVRTGAYSGHCLRRRNVSCGGSAAYAVWYSALKNAGCVLSGSI